MCAVGTRHKLRCVLDADKEFLSGQLHSLGQVSVRGQRRKLHACRAERRSEAAVDLVVTVVAFVYKLVAVNSVKQRAFGYFAGGKSLARYRGVPGNGINKCRYYRCAVRFEFG